jgi:hypothetical protein
MALLLLKVNLKALPSQLPNTTSIGFLGKLAWQQTPLSNRGEAVGVKDIRELLILLCVMLVVVFLWQRGEPELLPNSAEVRMAFRSR